MRRAMLLLAVVISMASPGVGAVITFTDSTFNNSDWTATDISAGTFVATQHLTGGNPGAFRYFASTSLQNAFVENVDAVATFNPAISGSILSLTLSYDIAPTTSGSLYEFPMVFQGGNYFVLMPSGLQPTSTSVWHSYNASSTTSADWVSDSSAAAHLDFTSSGAPIQFGVRFSDNVISGSCSMLCAEGGIDNFSATVNFAPAAVPEPSFAVPVTLCSLLLAFYVRGGRRPSAARELR